MLSTSPAARARRAQRAPTLLLVMHGTRDPRGVQAAHALAERVAALGRVPVRLGFADVCAPDVARAAAGVEGPLVAVPAFLAAGYHVCTDIPAQLAEAGRSQAPLTRTVGSDPRLVGALGRLLHRAGRRPGDAVVLGAAGSSAPRALAEVQRAARRLAGMVGAPVEVGYAATARPTVAEAVARARSRGASRVALASWLLAPGLFHTRMARSGAEVVGAPLCGDDALARAVVARYRAAAVRRSAV